MPWGGSLLKAATDLIARLKTLGLDLHDNRFAHVVGSPRPSELDFLRWHDTRSARNDRQQQQTQSRGKSRCMTLARTESAQEAAQSLRPEYSVTIWTHLHHRKSPCLCVYQSLSTPDAEDR